MCKLMFGYRARGYKESSPVGVDFRGQNHIFVSALQREQRMTLSVLTSGIEKLHQKTED